MMFYVCNSHHNRHEVFQIKTRRDRAQKPNQAFTKRRRKLWPGEWSLFFLSHFKRMVRIVNFKTVELKDTGIPKVPGMLREAELQCKKKCPDWQIQRQYLAPRLAMAVQQCWPARASTYPALLTFWQAPGFLCENMAVFLGGRNLRGQQPQAVCAAQHQTDWGPEVLRALWQRGGGNPLTKKYVFSSPIGNLISHYKLSNRHS